MPAQSRRNDRLTRINYNIKKMRKITLLLMAVLAAAVMNAQTTASLPEDATVEDDWLCSFVMHSSGGDETVSEPMQVAFSGQDVYFNLPNPVSGNAWVKGTIADGMAVFGAGQYLGNYSGAVYMVGQNADGLCDVVFGYDAEKQLFTLADMQVVLSASATSIDAWAYYTGMTVAKGGTAATEQWTFSYTMHYQGSTGEQTDTDSEPIEVTINGSEVAFRLPNPLNGAAWISGTSDGTTVTFAQGQQMGTYAGAPFYLSGMNSEGLCDVVFNYDEEHQRFTLGDMYLLINSSTTAAQPYCYFSSITIAKGAAPQTDDDQLVELPEGLTATDYVYTAKSVVYDQQGNVDHMENVARPVKVAMTGTEVYIRGLSEELPLAWVKGTVSTGSWDEKIVTFGKGQYLGQFVNYKLYLMGKYYGTFGDAYLELDGQQLKNRGYLYINTSKTQEAPLDVYANNQMKLLTPVAATPAAPTIEQYAGFNADEGYAPLMLTIPTTDVDGNVIAPSRLGFRLITEKDGEQHVYTFTREHYEDLPEQQMTVIPFELATGYNFYYGGSLLFVCDNLETNDRLGVQSVYTVGSTTHESATAWHTFAGTDAIATTTGNSTVVSETLTDLQGRRVPSSAHGILISRRQMADGTVTTTKVLR